MMVNVYFRKGKKLFSAVMVALAVMTLWGGDALASQRVRVPFVFTGQNAWGQYYYGDYETKGAEPTRTDWWGTADFGLENEATSPDAGNGTFIALDDADDLNWEYYSDNTLPVHSNGAVNVVIKYYGCGTNMVQGIAATDLGISPVVAGDGGDNVKAIFYHKTLEKENAGDTYYNYTAIPNPFSRRPVRTDTDVMTGANCKFLGFYGWAAEWSDCSLAYADGTSFDENSYADNIVLPGKKLKVTVTGSNPTITFKALWDQCVVQTGTTSTGMTTPSNATDYATLYERQFNVILNTAAFTAHTCPATYSQLYPDGTDGGQYDAMGYISAITPRAIETIDNKFEYMNFAGNNFQKLVSAATNNTTSYVRFVVGRGMRMQTPTNFNGLYQNNSKYNMRFGQGLDVRVESGNYTHIYALSNTYGWNTQYVTTWVNVANAVSNFTLGSDYDRWKNDNSKLIVSNEVHMTHMIRFATQAPMFDASVKSGTFGTSADDEMNFGMYLLNQLPVRYSTSSDNYPSGILYAGRNVVMEGGVVNSSIYGGRDENILYTGTSASLSFNGAGYAISNGTLQDVSSLYYTFKMKGGTLNGDFYGGDNVSFSLSGTSRMEITAQPRRIAFVGGTVNGSVYGGSKFDDASSASTLTNNTHMSALALTDVDMYIGGNVALGSNLVYGGDNNTANSAVKTLHSVHNVNMVVADGISVNEVYGGGNGAGLGKDYAYDVESSAIASRNPKSNVNICLKGVTVGNVYGGIKGDSNPDQIMGSSEITINGGTYTNVYGGGNGTGSEIQGPTTVTLNSGNVTNVYGGGNQGNVGQFTSDVAAVNINGGTVSGSVYGGGFQGYSYSSPAVNIKGGSVGGSVYGGANGGASYQDEVYTRGVRTVNVADNANISGDVYGGSINADDQVIGVEKGYSGTTSKYGQAPLWPVVNTYVQQFILSNEEAGGAKIISAMTFEAFWNKIATTASLSRTLNVYMQEIDDDYYTGYVSATPYSDLRQPTIDDKVVNAKTVTLTGPQEGVTIDFDTPFYYSGNKAICVTLISTAGSKSGTISTITGSGNMSSLTTNFLLWNSYNRDYCQYIYCGTSTNGTVSNLVEGSSPNIKNSSYYNSSYIYGQNAVPAVRFAYTVDESITKGLNTAFVNVTKGSVGGSVYGSGNGNKMYGGCYVNIGANAVQNAPGHSANVNALETLTAGSIAISGSVYAGSNGTGSWAYTATNRSISGVSNVYLDGSGYSNAINIGGSKGTSAGNIYGCSTNGEGGKLGSHVWISNIGSRNAEGKELSSTTWGLNSVQHTDTLMLNNAHVTFNGAQRIEGSDNNSIYGIHKVMRVVNNSTALLKADADSIAKVGSYHCDDVYADEPVYTEVTAVEGSTGKTQLADCKNTIVFANGSNLYVRTMESGSEVYGELQGYLYAHNNEGFTMAQARARVKDTDNSPFVSDTDYPDDGGFVSYEGIYNTYDNPPTDNYDGTGDKQEIAFRNVSSTPAYREWNLDNLTEITLIAKKGTGGSYKSGDVTLPSPDVTSWYLFANQDEIYPKGGLFKRNLSFNTVALSSVDDLDMAVTAEAATDKGWSAAVNEDLVAQSLLPGGEPTTPSMFVGTTTSSVTEATMKFVLHFDDEFDYDDDTLGYAIVRFSPTSTGESQSVLRIWILSEAESVEPHLWTEFVTENPGVNSFEIVNDTVLIKDKYGLAWFISYVNGYNGSDEHPYVKAKLCANVNMNEHVWVPIGYSTLHEFKGFFDGQCYFIDSIHIANAQEHQWVERKHGNLQRVGLFGYVDGIDVVAEEKDAYIRNTFVTTGVLYGNSAFTYIGSIIGSANETMLEFCEGAADIYAGNGVSVGSVCGSIIHDSYAKACMGMSTIQSKATNTGGIAGAMSDASLGDLQVSYLEHSFANSNITALTTSAYKTGAVVGYFYGQGFADPVYVHPNASGATNILGDILVSLGTNAPRGYAYNSTMNYQLVLGTPVPIRSVYTAVSAVDYTHHATGNNVTISGLPKPLYEELNSYTSFQDGTTLESLGLTWNRVYGITAINGDYPILYPQNKIDGRVIAVAQRTGEKALRYGSVDDLITSCNENPGGGTIYMYQNDTIRVATNDNVVVYVNENVALYQTAAKVNAVVAITLDNSKGNGEMNRDWHMFSSTIKEGKTGIMYGSQTIQVPDFDGDDYLSFGENQDYWLDEDEDVYFPNGISSVAQPGKQFDLYSFCEPEYHWINLKRVTNNHWHQDEPHDQITSEAYVNETVFTPGKGYMIALGDKTTHNNNLMQAKGELNNGTVSAYVSNVGEHLTGYNLLGNPYQSYLDFKAFAGYGSNATNLWKADTVGTKAFLIYDADKNGFIEYLSDEGGVSFSQNAEEVTSQYIHPHQAFFVVKNTETQGTSEVRFDNTMRNLKATDQFRDEAPAYPLVNLRCTDSEGKWEHSVIELERPLAAGSLKLKELLSGKGSMYIHWADNDYRSVFIDHMPDYVPVWFEASEDGVFTMTWNTANANFGYMHLIDNLTGTDYDCLAPGNDHYTFEARTTDMAARFRLVFKPLGIEEETIENGENFAFFNGEQLIVNGIGDLQLIDVNGRILMTEHLSGEQNSISLPNVAAGMYMLRLNSDSESRIQKIVVRK